MKNWKKSEATRCVVLAVNILECSNLGGDKSGSSLTCGVEEEWVNVLVG